MLIQLVRERPAIWKLSDERHKHRGGTVLTDWLAVEAKLLSTYGQDTLVKMKLNTHELIKKRWESLKNKFHEMRRIRRGKSGAAARDIAPGEGWPHLKSMMFLLASRPNIQTSSSLPMPEVRMACFIPRKP